MANFSVTPALVKPSAAALAAAKRGVSGGAITAGSPVYLDKADGRKIKLAESGDTTAKAAVVGIALTGSSDGQPVLYATEDPDLDLGVTIGNRVTVVLSATPGRLCPDADIVSGRKTVLGVGNGTTKIKFKPIAG